MMNFNNIVRMACLIVEISAAKFMDYERDFFTAMIGRIGFTGLIFVMVFITAYTIGIFHNHGATDR